MRIPHSPREPDDPQIRWGMPILHDLTAKKHRDLRKHGYAEPA